LLLAPAITEAASGLFLSEDEDFKNLLLSFDVFDVTEVETTASTVAVFEQHHHHHHHHPRHHHPHHQHQLQHQLQHQRHYHCLRLRRR
jgi:hypothetical protein